MKLALALIAMAMLCVSALGQDQTKDVNLLIKNLKNDNSTIRADAAKALGEINDTKAVYPLIQALKDEDRNVRQWSVLALVKMGGLATEELILALESENETVRWQAAAVLGLLRDLNRRLGQTILMITHNPEAAEYGHRTVHMRDGRVEVEEHS